MALALWLLYAAAVAFALVHGRGGADCGCTLGRRPVPMGAFQLVRLGVLLPVAGLALFAGEGWPGVAAPLAAATLFVIYLAAEELAATHARGMLS